MNQENNQYNWKELKTYLEAFIEAQVERDMNDPDFTEIGRMENAHRFNELNWTEDKSRKNAIENLKESLVIIFPNELIDIEV